MMNEVRKPINSVCYSIRLPICTVATVVKAVCKCCGGGVLGEVRVLIATLFNHMSKL
jgi:hypothetical protein